MTEEIEEKPELEPEQEPVAEAPSEPDHEAESEARKYGWKPKEEFTLAPEGWVDASRFLELPSTQTKMLRDVNRRLERELGERDKVLSKVSEMQERAMQRVRDQERQAYEERIARIEEAKRQAVEVGDVAQYDKLSQDQRKLAPPSDEPEPKAEPEPEVKAYIEGAKWLKDPNAYAFAYQLIEDNPNVKRLPATKQIAWAEARVKEFFPEHFEEPKPKQTFSKVDGGGTGPLGKRGKGADDLPPEARAAAEMYVKEKLYKSVDEYAKEYFEIGG